MPNPLRNLFIIACVIATLFSASMLYDRLFPARGMPATEKSLPLPAAPDFAVDPVNGPALRLSDMRGKVVIVNFWATWCAPCVVEFPILINLASLYDGRVVFLALSSDKDTKTVTTFLDQTAHKMGIKINPTQVVVAVDKDRNITRDMFRVTTYPESLIITPDGRIARHIVGIDAWKDPETTRLIDELLNSK
jgi:cytochrome c biogenesis protein CcmG/thiol:disulfide interchange protein DsbE